MPATIEVELEGLIPKRMPPATLLLFEKAEGELSANPDLFIPFAGVFSCPRCETIGYMTDEQVAGLRHKICGSDNCSAEYRLSSGPSGGKEIEFREPM